MYVYIIYIIYTFIDYLAVHITVIILVVVWTRVQEKITPILHANKLCLSKYCIEWSQGQHKKLSRSSKAGLTNSDNLAELL